MERIREKPTLGERVKEKAVSDSKGLLRKGLDDGSERLRMQLRDAAQQGSRDEYGGDAVEDTAAGGLRRAERELLKQRKMKTAERSASSLRDASAHSPEGDAPPNIRTGEAVKTKSACIRTQGETAVTAAPEPRRQGRQAFMQEQGRRASRQQVQRRQAEQRLQRQSAAPLRWDNSTSNGREMASRGRIKERGGQLPKDPHRPGSKAPGRTAGAAPRIREGGKAVRRSAERTVHASSAHAAAAGTKAAREAAAQTARRQRTAKAAEASAQKIAQAAGRALRSILAAERSRIAALMAGGSAAAALVLVICLIGLLVASPFGIFFSREKSRTDCTMQEAVSTLNGEFSDRIEQIKAENPYDKLDMDNAGSVAMISNWRDVLAIYAVRTTTNDTAPDEVATLTEEKLEILREVFWDMSAISSCLETVSGGEDEDDIVILHITVMVKDRLQMADAYQFSAEQRRLLEELMQPEYQELFAALTGSYQDIELSPDEVARIMENLPADLSEERRHVVLTAYQLVGKVRYFWGGKSLVIGWDSRWGTPTEVTAEGSATTGTVRPFGLDCSGFVDWAFYNASDGGYILGRGGGAAAQHSGCTPITWDGALPGDLAFFADDSHVGIVCGRDANGELLIIHCASGANNVVVTGKDGFTSIGRPNYFDN